MTLELVVGVWRKTLRGNLAAGEVVQWTIPADKAGKYIQIRTRIRDNNGTGGSGVYKQVWSTLRFLRSNPILNTKVKGAPVMKTYKQLMEVMSISDMNKIKGGTDHQRKVAQDRQKRREAKNKGFDPKKSVMADGSKPSEEKKDCTY